MKYFEKVATGLSVGRIEKAVKGRITSMKAAKAAVPRMGGGNHGTYMSSADSSKIYGEKVRTTDQMRHISNMSHKSLPKSKANFSFKNQTASSRKASKGAELKDSAINKVLNKGNLSIRDI